MVETVITKQAHEAQIQAAIDSCSPAERANVEALAYCNETERCAVIKTLDAADDLLSPEGETFLREAFASVEAFKALSLVDRCMAMEAATDIMDRLTQAKVKAHLKAILGTATPPGPSDYDEEDDPFGDLDD